MKNYFYSLIVLTLISLISCKTESDSRINVTIKGETFALCGTEPKQFLYTCNKILRVYSYDSYGNIVEYTMNDYIFFESSNTISRSDNSSIPDFNEYLKTVVFNSNGTFSWISAPRNPPLTINYNVYVDYVSDKEPCIIKSDFCITEKMEDIKILVCGDSIARGAQTIAYHYRQENSDSFTGLLDKYLTYQNIEHSIENNSVIGSDISTILVNINTIISNKYDVVIVEFGMNDHMQGQNGEDAFTNGLHTVCSTFKEKGIQVILVGFFQETKLWDAENTDNTKRYNMIIRNVAMEYGLPFIDIYSLFENIAVKKIIVDDMTADWMHHPTNFGHKVYFSALVPYFTYKEINSSYLQDYVLY